MAEFKNDFSWSKSRDETFRTCPRRYCFQYYGSWGGWDATAPERTRHLYVLKQLVTRPMWAGSVVHDCIEHSLKNVRRGIDVLSPERIIEVTLAKMRDDFRSSRKRNYWKRPKSCALFEHEYAVPVSDEEWRETAGRVRECLRFFYGSDLFASLRARPRDSWLEIEQLGQFTLDDIPIWAKIDCSYRDGDRVRIIDWKTGRSMADKTTLQLVCYALYAHEKWGVPIESVDASEVYLLAGRTNDYVVSPIDLDDTRAYIRGSVADMHSLLADVTHNEPMAEAAFERTESEGACRRCNFLRLCRPELLPGQAAAPSPTRP